MDDMIRIVSDQTALGLERHHLYTGVEKIGLTDEFDRPVQPADVQLPY